MTNNEKPDRLKNPAVIGPHAAADFT